MLPRSLKEVIHNMVYIKVVDVNKTIHIKIVSRLSESLSLSESQAFHWLMNQVYQKCPLVKQLTVSLKP